MESISRAVFTRGSSERGVPREMLKTSLVSLHGKTASGFSSEVNSRLMIFLYLSRSGTINPILIPGRNVFLAHLEAWMTSSTSSVYSLTETGFRFSWCSGQNSTLPPFPSIPLMRDAIRGDISSNPAKTTVSGTDILLFLISSVTFSYREACSTKPRRSTSFSYTSAHLFRAFASSVR